MVGTKHIFSYIELPCLQSFLLNEIDTIRRIPGTVHDRPSGVKDGMPNPEVRSFSALSEGPGSQESHPVTVYRVSSHHFIHLKVAHPRLSRLRRMVFCEFSIVPSFPTNIDERCELSSYFSDR